MAPHILNIEIHEEFPPELRAPPQQQKQPTSATLSAEDARALEVIEQQHLYMQSFCRTEDFDM